jgi:hypothetical protein
MAHYKTVKRNFDTFLDDLQKQSEAEAIISKSKRLQER